jgi:hypothetical protein
VAPCQHVGKILVFDTTGYTDGKAILIQALLLENQSLLHAKAALLKQFLLLGPCTTV